MATTPIPVPASGYPDLPDPSDQKKVEDILETIGLHPAQQHVQGMLNGAQPQPTLAQAQPQAAALTMPGVGAAPKAALIDVSAPAPPAPADSSPKVRIPSPMATAAPPGMPVSTPGPMIKTPQEQNAIDQTVAAQGELGRMNKTGSGISQIKNPFLRTLARIGDVAGTALFPGLTAAIPGTELHHDVLMGQQKNLINEGLGEQKELAQTAEEQARTEDLANPKPQLEMTDQGLVRVPQVGDAEPVKMGGTQLTKVDNSKDSLQNLYADAVRDALSKGQDPEQDPAVQHYADAITAIQKQPQEATSVQDYKQWLKDNKLDDNSANKLKYDGILAAAKQAPQRAPQVTVMVPNANGGATLESLHPGQTVAPGAMSPTQFGSANVPTAATRTMAETAPKVLELSDRVDKLIDEQVKTLGPASSRWNEFMAGKVGAPNPEFTKLRTDVGLLQTALMRMHVGARGGEQMMEHFQNLIDVSKQSPENLKAALEEIREYAKAVQTEGRPGGGGNDNASQGPKVGEVDNGYKFKGGNASDPKNWEKVSK